MYILIAQSPSGIITRHAAANLTPLRDIIALAGDDLAGWRIFDATKGGGWFDGSPDAQDNPALRHLNANPQASTFFWGT